MNIIQTTIKEIIGIPEEQTIRQHFGDPIVVQTLLKMLTIFAIVGGILLYTSIEIKESAFFSRDIVFGWLHWFGPWAWVLYIVLLVIAVMSPLPDALVIVAGGFFFGPVIGSLLTVIGQGLGAVIDFLLARRLGRNFVKSKFPKSASLIDRYSDRLGWQTVFLMRLFPTVSFDMLSYAAGVSRLSFRKYLIATVSGLIPLAVITTMLGHSVNLHSSRLAILSVGIGILSIAIISGIFFFLSSYKQKMALKKI
jgi:uncharacterized membrane protein YdjX (TVP38/TMEM64 family)